MEKDTIGAILRNRIKEMGYSQEDFAEKAGIGISSLKKYMNGTVAYSYELLLVFADILDCSYDYLLGFTKSAKRELQDIGDLLRLSDDAIQKIVNYSKYYDDSFEAKRYITSLDAMIKTDGLIMSITDYLITSRYLETSCKLTTEVIKASLAQSEKIPKEYLEDSYLLSMENQILIGLITQLKIAKQSIAPDILKEIKAIEPIDKLTSDMQMLIDKY